MHCNLHPTAGSPLCCADHSERGLPHTEPTQAPLGVQFGHPTRRLSVVRGAPQPATAALERLAKTPCRLLTGPKTPKRAPCGAHKSPQGAAWTGVALPHVFWSKLPPGVPTWAASFPNFRVPTAWAYPGPVNGHFGPQRARKRAKSSLLGAAPTPAHPHR